MLADPPGTGPQDRDARASDGSEPESSEPERLRAPDHEAPGAARRGGYLGFVAHEVRNPLSTALWSAELLARMPAGERGGPRGEKLTAMCLRSLGRVRQLIEDHFMCERLDVAGLHVRPEPVDVRELLEAIAARRPAGSPPLDLRVEPGTSVDVDRALLERMIDSLVALAGRENAPVRIESALEGDSLRLVFLGHPVAPEMLDDPRKGSPGEPRGRALAGPLARRAAETLGSTLRIADGGLVLTLAGAAYTPPAA
jgi:signal transduction histidine kinase